MSQRQLMRAKQESEIHGGGKEEREGCVVFPFPLPGSQPKAGRGIHFAFSSCIVPIKSLTMFFLIFT